MSARQPKFRYMVYWQSALFKEVVGIFYVKRVAEQRARALRRASPEAGGCWIFKYRTKDDVLLETRAFL
jgi:hypothetical protein